MTITTKISANGRIIVKVDGKITAISKVANQLVYENSKSRAIEVIKENGEKHILDIFATNLIYRGKATDMVIEEITKFARGEYKGTLETTDNTEAEVEPEEYAISQDAMQVAIAWEEYFAEQRKVEEIYAQHEARVLADPAIEQRYQIAKVQVKVEGNNYPLFYFRKKNSTEWNYNPRAAKAFLTKCGLCAGDFITKAKADIATVEEITPELDDMFNLLPEVDELNDFSETDPWLIDDDAEYTDRDARFTATGVEPSFHSLKQYEKEIAAEPTPDFDSQIAALQAEVNKADNRLEQAKAALDAAQQEAAQKKIALWDFLEEHAKTLREKFYSIIPERIKFKGELPHTFYTTNASIREDIYFDAVWQDAPKFNFRIYNGKLLATYQTPAQVETVIEMLKDALNHGEEFTFPTVAELNKSNSKVA